jgi:hypothetical protein
MTVPPNFQQQVIAALNSRGTRAACEVCGQNNWAAVDQPVAINITDLSGNVLIPAPQIPAAALICNNCGNVRLHALGALGLLPVTKEEAK